MGDHVRDGGIRCGGFCISDQSDKRLVLQGARCTLYLAVERRVASLAIQPPMFEMKGTSGSFSRGPAWLGLG